MKFGEAEGGKPKPKGPLAALLAGGSDSDAPTDIEVDVEEPEVDHGFRAVAKAFGIPPEREEAAQAALKQYIQSCKGSESEDEDY